MGAVPYLAFAWTLPAPTLAHLARPVGDELAFLALGRTAGMLLWNLAVLCGGTTRISLLLYLEPAVSVAGAAAQLREHLTPGMIGGGMLILAGVATSSVTGPHRIHHAHARQEDTADADSSLDHPEALATARRARHCHDLPAGAAPAE